MAIQTTNATDHRTNHWFYGFSWFFASTLLFVCTLQANLLAANAIKHPPTSAPIWLRLRFSAPSPFTY